MLVEMYPIQSRIHFHGSKFQFNYPEPESSNQLSVFESISNRVSKTGPEDNNATTKPRDNPKGIQDKIVLSLL